MSRTGRQGLFAGVAVVLFAVAGYSLFAGRNSVTVGRESTVSGICLACKAEGEVTCPRIEQPPYRCPKCGERAFLPWLVCNDCNKRFVPALLPADGSGPRRMRANPVCPSCGSSSVTQFFPNLPDMQPAGDAPLPKWP
jgi:ribosomal protein S27AE